MDGEKLSRACRFRGDDDIASNFLYTRWPMHCQSEVAESAGPAGPADIRRGSRLRRLGMLVLLFSIPRSPLARAEPTASPAPHARAVGAPAEEVVAPSLPPEPPEQIPPPGGDAGHRGAAPGATSVTPAADEVPASPGQVVVAASRRHRSRVGSLSHHHQLGLAVLIGDGYRGIFPYQDDRVCGDATGDDSARVCTNRAPLFVDVRPSFGISRAWDVLLDLRFGLRADFNTKRQFFVMPGFRYWLDPQSRVKFFTTMQLAYDRSLQNQVGVKNEDLAVRNSNGLMVELVRNFGVYAQFGETIGFLRWLSFMVDGGVGVEARFP
jgi:hypothetical protein